MIQNKKYQYNYQVKMRFISNIPFNLRGNDG